METSDCIEHAMQYLELLFADGDWVELRLVPPGRSKWFQSALWRRQTWRQKRANRQGCVRRLRQGLHSRHSQGTHSCGSPANALDAD